ncbi:glutathionylspermidine synthase family protein [Bacillus sp. V5-8f]|uniref:glutathionylspermidine synthase family protein n=1 Tax=Bacillus sp. V5-8f TaxID=2053044 RepID=UPI0021553040|nr:glutathionylspermidine synthase family protein [Bacillus sp. V5-8f]
MKNCKQSWRNERYDIYGQIPDFWHDLYNSEYALLDIKLETVERIQAIRRAAENAGRIFFKTARLLRMLDDETLMRLGFPRETLSYTRIKTLEQESVIARIDFVVNAREIKVMEINSDTPTFIKETFHVNKYLCAHLNYQNSNEGCEEELAAAIQEAILSELNRQRG